MIRSLYSLLRAAPDRSRVALFVLMGVLAVVVGFVTVPPTRAEELIGAGGYYYILGLFTLFLFFGMRVWSESAPAWKEWRGRPLLVLVMASAFAIWCDPFKHKILFDEYVLQGTAFHMHATKEIGTVIRAYDIAGTWLPIDTFLDKRPYFFTFLISLVHDLTGYRLANAFIVNITLAPFFLALVWWLGGALAGRGPAMMAVALLGTLPLLGQQASGAGMELHNLAMLALVMALAVHYVRAPSDDRLSLLVIGTVLLSQSRYESVIFVVPAALVIVIGWLRVGRVLLPWAAVAAPLLLVPYAWHNRVLSASPLLWQLQEGQTSRFSFKYLAGNLEGAWTFFLNFGPNIPNSWYLSILGFGGMGWALVAGWKWARSPVRAPIAPELLVLLAFGGGVVANLLVLMFYYWSRLDDTMASRFALPMYFILALVSALLLRRLEWWRPAVMRYAAGGLGVWLLIWCFPSIARHTYTSQNLVMQEVEWEHEQLLRRQGPLLFISNKSTIPFVLWRVPTIINGVGRQRPAQISYHLREGTFKEVIVAQALRPTSAQGAMGVDPDDLMPANFRLETIAEKRFGGRYSRLSRLVAIDELPASGGKNDASATKKTAPSGE